MTQIAPASDAARTSPLSSVAVGALLRSMIAEELGVQRRRAIPHADTLKWSDAVTVDEEENGLGVDSLARLAVVARVNTFFHMHEAGTEDYLLVRRSLGEWTELVMQTLAFKGERFTLQTSGSTGAPKTVTHNLVELEQEVAAWRGRLPVPGRVISYVPPHHMYGFVWTVLLPAAWGAEVLDARSWGVSRLAREANEGDLIVATPFHWSQLTKTPDCLPQGALAVSSGAPLPDAMLDTLASGPLAGAWEIYGASETGGVAWRTKGGAPFTLLDYWRWNGVPNTLKRKLVDGGARTYSLPDNVNWEGERLRVGERQDGAVQVGGVNVYPDRLCETLRGHPDVSEAAVRLDSSLNTADGASARLKAFVVPQSPDAKDNLADQLLAYCAERHKAVERPVHITIGDALPYNEMGKLTDW